jgi:hypothetical protein
MHVQPAVPWCKVMHLSQLKSGIAEQNCCDAVMSCVLQVPDNGKVGVIGSGKGLTEYKKQKRHEFSVDD